MELTINEVLKKGIDAHKSGDYQVAETYYGKILVVEPNHAHANHNMGLLAISAGRIAESIPFFEKALKADSGVAQFWFSYMDVLIQLGRRSAAKAALDQARTKGAKGETFDRFERKLASFETTSSNFAGNSNKTCPSNILDELRLDEALLKAKQKSLDGELEGAIKIYRDVISRFPQNTRATKELKRVLTKLNQEAPNFQNLPQEQFQALVSLYNKRKFNELLQKAFLLLDQFPGSYSVYNIIGVTYADSGQVDLAINYYKKAIKFYPYYAEAFLNMGSSLKEKGDLSMAIESYQKAIKIKPDYAQAYYNMGNVFKSKGEQKIGDALERNNQFDSAIDCYDKALKIRSDYAQAYLNMGNVFREKGELDFALDSYKNALKIKADYAEVYNNLALTLNDKDDFEGAMENFVRALEIKPNFTAVYRSVGVVLGNKKFNRPNPELQRILAIMLDQKGCVRPRAIASSVSSLLKFEPAIINFFKVHSQGELVQSTNECILELSRLPLLLKFMSVCPFSDLEFEEAFTNLRLTLLFSQLEKNKTSEFLRFQSALALQCFINEYVYDKSDEEEHAVERLKHSIEKSFSNGEQPNPELILCLASYEPLNHFEWSKYLIATADTEEVVVRQILEPNAEAELKNEIPLLCDIKDPISSVVKDQYELNPYPRWINLGLQSKSFPIAEFFNDAQLRLGKDTVTDITRPNILIAGCGTGQHSIETAATFRNSKILAVDLSLTSLAYAKRKTQEYGFKNIEYMQADILDLGKYKEQFDIVESVGVLHHMSDPMAGWKMITSCVKPGGLIKIGLYSEIARRTIAKIRGEIRQRKSGWTDKAMKAFRREVVKSEKKHLRELGSYTDFYSTSELRDLLFHVQEHRFTLIQIKKCISTLGLEFCGFESSDLMKSFAREYSEPDDLYNLDKWNSYEELHRTAFRNMYQFWCQKS